MCSSFFSHYLLIFLNYIKSRYSGATGRVICSKYNVHVRDLQIWAVNWRGLVIWDQGVRRGQPELQL